ncbi:ABC transporter ATP-binding protein [Gemella cuniculi]|uniref:ABC transporter ATP-binding protein n=1 Tax=Gemella cuniculi TaxID=150240 RepID=UPI000408CFB9|nr:ABC transporter ATP-binding protein [Gemella cuniculi]
MYLKIKKVTKEYKNKEVLKNVSFEVEEGKLFCILGPSGCGKTTLLNIIGGFIDDFFGEVVLSNENISKVVPEKRPIATVFQSYGLFPHKNVIENVGYGLKFLKLPKKEILRRSSEVLEKVGLYGYERKRIDELSGGEQQRVAIARSLVLNPKVLLLDEPFSNLDANLRVDMRTELKKIQKEFNITTIVVTHDQDDAFRIADKIILLNNGIVEQIGRPKEIYFNPKTEFVANFIGENNRIKAKEYVRPEQIKLNLNNLGKYTIIGKIFLGMYTEYIVKSEEGRVLKCVRLSSEEELSINERVDVEF